MKNIQILLETVVRCGGNCSGCALSSSERMTKADFDFTAFKSSVKKVYGYIKEIAKVNEIESLSIFLGQGDHFLLTDDDLKSIVGICDELIPLEIKHKTVILLTASAIGKNTDIQRKMDLIYNESIRVGIPMFIQTVFDPKKIIETKNFKDTYIKNILYLKEKCGMTDLTINLGQDFLEMMSPQEFHNWVVEYQFNHVEANWVINKNTQKMWLGNITSMHNWIKEWLLIYKNNPAYEINFIPIALRILANKDLPILKTQKVIEQSLTENLYIDSSGNLIPCKIGPINNLTPVQERMMGDKIININALLTGKQVFEELKRVSVGLSKKAINKVITHKVCALCPYKSVCATNGASTWLNYDGNESGCPWNVKELYELLEKEFSTKKFKETSFYKNPVQSDLLKINNNETSQWFDKEVIKRLKNEE